MINGRDISVVVQGPVVGSPGDPYDKRLTLQSLESVRRHLPQAEIVLSTWRASDVSGLPYDVLIESDDPGAVWCNATPDYPAPPYNANRQITSTRAGLLAATKPFAMKLRSDMALAGNGFLDYFGRYTARAERWRILGERVVVCDVISRNPRRKYPYPFHPSDWFHFGRREDVLNIWDIPHAPEPETSRWLDTHPRPANDFETWAMYRYTVEQYVWLSFLRKHGEVEFEFKSDLTNDAINESELTLANNLVIAEISELDLRFLKYPLPKSTWVPLYTHGDWQRMYKRFCDSRFRCPPDATLWRKRLSVVTFMAASPQIYDMSSRWKAASPASYGLMKKLYVSLFNRKIQAG